MHNIHLSKHVIISEYVDDVSAFYVYLCQNSTKLLFVTPNKYQEVLRL